MVAVLHDNLWFCQDCTIFACNGDTSGMSDETEDCVTKGAKALATAWALQSGNAVPNFDSETGEGILEFAHMGCDCCGSRLAGDRHRFSILGSVPRYIVRTHDKYHTSSLELRSELLEVPGDVLFDVVTFARFLRKARVLGKGQRLHEFRTEQRLARIVAFPMNHPGLTTGAHSHVFEAVKSEDLYAVASLCEGLAPSVATWLRTKPCERRPAASREAFAVAANLAEANGFAQIAVWLLNGYSPSQ